MVAKKKKMSGKKPAQKAVKKSAKTINKASPKKVAKKIVKKAAKKAVKKSTVKQVSQKNKAAKSGKVNPAKKSSKPSKVSKRVVAKPTKQTTNHVAKKPVKTVKKSAPEKTMAVAKTVVRPAVTQPATKPSKPKQQDSQDTKKQTMIEQSKKKMTEKTAYASRDDMVATVVTEVAPRKKSTTLLGALEFTPYQPAADETYMSDRQREHFRRILDAWKQQLMQDVDLTVGHLKEDAVFYADPVDRAAQEEGFNLELRTRDRERKLIKKIEQSLDLLNTGEYGYCEDCGAEIGIRRLEARPTAVKCIDCKTFQEIREKQLGG